MHFETRFSPGDRVFVVCGAEVRHLTIGQVRIEHTDSPGLPFPQGDIQFDNYKPQKGHVESYMCVETGIRAGMIYKLGEDVFETEAEAIAVAEKRKTEEAERVMKRKIENKRNMKKSVRDAQKSLDYRKAELAEVEKAEREAGNETG